MNPNSFRIPIVTERKPTADELFMQALKAKHECIVGYLQDGFRFNYTPLQDCEKEFNEAIEHYKKLAWKEEQ
nr:MAG TPA: hypothetical protein [Caudoviricetes sp.]